MELFLFILGILVAFAALSLIFGADSRVGYRDERQLPLASPWI